MCRLRAISNKSTRTWEDGDKDGIFACRKESDYSLTLRQVSYEIDKIWTKAENTRKNSVKKVTSSKMVEI